jgi:hypothetical protein
MGTLRRPASKVQEMGVMGGVAGLVVWGAQWLGAQYGLPVEPVAAVGVGLVAAIASKVRDVFSRL